MDHTSWLQRWMVFEAAMLGLGAASPASLKKYRDGIQTLVNEWPDKWFEVATADQQVRTYQWDRLREDLLELHPLQGGILESEGWDRIIRLSAYEGMSGKGPLASWAGEVDRGH